MTAHGLASGITAKRLLRANERHQTPPHQTSATGGHQVVFLGMAAAGHVYPMLPLVTALQARGCHVLCYLAPSAEEHIVAAVKASGASVRTYCCSIADEPLLSGLRPRERVVSTEMRWLPALLDDLRVLKPMVLLYDTFMSIGPAAGYLSGVPAVGLTPHCGPGWQPAPSGEADGELRRPCEWLRRQYGLDLIAHGFDQSWHVNSTRLSLMLTLPALFAPPVAAQQARLVGVSFECIGSLASSGTRRPLHGAGTSSSDTAVLARVRAVRSTGTRTLLLSLGTLITGAFWSMPLGGQVDRQGSSDQQGSSADQQGGRGTVLATALVKDNDDGTTLHGRTLAQLTGRDFAHFVWRCAIDAFGGRDGVLVVVAHGRPSGGGYSAHASGETTLAANGVPAMPNNFVVVSTVPQLELLPLCDACALRSPVHLPCISRARRAPASRLHLLTAHWACSFVPLTWQSSLMAVWAA